MWAIGLSRHFSKWMAKKGPPDPCRSEWRSYILDMIASKNICVVLAENQWPSATTQKHLRKVAVVYWHLWGVTSHWVMAWSIVYACLLRRFHVAEGGGARRTRDCLLYFCYSRPKSRALKKATALVFAGPSPGPGILAARKTAILIT